MFLVDTPGTPLKALVLLAALGLSTSCMAGEVATTVQAATAATRPQTCSKNFVEARVERVYADVVRYQTVDGRHGAIARATASVAEPGGLICVERSLHRY